MTLLYSLLAVIGEFYATWLMFCAIMALWKAKREGTLTKTCRILGAPLLGVGYVFDATANILASVILLDLPREVLLTMKLQRIQRTEPTGWRNAVAKWVCVNMLNPADPTGHHC